MPEITKRRVTMRNIVATGKYDADGRPEFQIYEVVDYVRPDFLDAYVADAQTKYQSVEVSDEPDAGPGGYDGATYVPEGLDSPLAGQTFAATKKGK